MSRHFRLALMVCAIAIAGSAGAATRTGNLAVTATVVNNCLLTTATMAFGTYTPGAGNRNANGQIRVVCSNGMPYAIGLGSRSCPRCHGNQPQHAEGGGIACVPAVQKSTANAKLGSDPGD